MLFNKMEDTPLSAKVKNILLDHTSEIFLYLYILLICRMMAFCLKILHFNYFAVTLIFVSTNIIIALIKQLSAKHRKYLLSILTAAFALSCILFYKWYTTLLFKYIISNIRILDRLVYKSLTTYFSQFFPLLMILIPILCLAVALTKDRIKFDLSIPLSLFGLLYFSYMGFDNRIRSYLLVYFLITLLSITVSIYKLKANTLQETKLVRYIHIRNILLLAIPFCITVLLTALFFVQLSGTKSFAERILGIDYIAFMLENANKDSIFDLSTTGFLNNDKKLGGPIKPNQQIVMTVKSDRPYYLRGIVKDFYDGSRWIKSDAVYAQKDHQSPLAVASDYIRYFKKDAANQSVGQNRSPSLTSKRMQITPERLSTSTLFSPANTYDVNLEETVSYDRDNTFILSNGRNMRHSYVLSFYLSNVGLENFQTFSPSAFDFDYETSSKVLFEQDNYTRQVKTPYAKYLEVPDTVPPAIYELVNNLTKDCKNNKEKIEKIYLYLSRTLSYSLDVSEVPEGEDFVNYFITKEKKGYCTYFATAATVFARIAGVPARYVEGYKMSNRKDDNDNYVVSNNRAHAWTEILTSAQANIWCTLDCVPPSAPIALDGDRQTPAPTGNQNSMSQIDKYLLYDGSGPEGGSTALLPDEAGTAGSEKNTASHFINKILSVSLIILLLFLCFMLCFILYRIKKHIENKQLILKSNSIVPFYEHMRKRLSYLDLNTKISQTDAEFVSNISDVFLKKRIEEIVNVYYDEFYGNLFVPLDRKQLYKEIEKDLKKKQQLLPYYYYLLGFPKNFIRKRKE